MYERHRPRFRMRPYQITDQGTKHGRGIIVRRRGGLRRGDLIFAERVRVFADPPPRPASQDICPTDHDALFCRGDGRWVLLRDHVGEVHSKLFWLNSSWRGPGLPCPEGNVSIAVNGSVLTVRASVKIPEGGEVVWGYQWWN